ncbi:MAG: Rha family transcriptional regulator [Enterocloster sp.]
MLVEITQRNNEEVLTASSRQVADKFEKEHRHVLESIDKMKEQLSTAEFSALFMEGKYVASNGKKNKEYLMTRDGFSLLVMGFTGEKVLRWKLDYIKAFNEMEKELKRLYSERQKWEIERQKGILVRHILTDTIKMKVTDSPHKKFMYPNYTKLIYKTIFGKTMKELQEQYGVKGKESIREYVTADELKQIESMEMLVSSLINCGWGYNQIKGFIQENSVKMLAG